MKRLILFTVSILLFSSLNAQISRVKLIEYLENEGYDVSIEDYAYLEEGEYDFEYKTFYPSSDYVIVAYSEDSDVSDIDLKLYSSSGTLLKSDTDASAQAVIEYSPSYEKKCKMVYKNYSSYGSSSHKIRLLVAYK